ncbi:hypothetical protein D3C87_1906320 [compost metagenome]
MASIIEIHIAPQLSLQEPLFKAVILPLQNASQRVMPPVQHHDSLLELLEIQRLLV